MTNTILTLLQVLCTTSHLALTNTSFLTKMFLSTGNSSWRDMKPSVNCKCCKYYWCTYFSNGKGLTREELEEVTDAPDFILIKRTVFFNNKEIINK
jgi:hypothetical protein